MMMRERMVSSIAHLSCRCPKCTYGAATTHSIVVDGDANGGDLGDAKCLGGVSCELFFQDGTTMQLYQNGRKVANVPWAYVPSKVERVHHYLGRSLTDSVSGSFDGVIRWVMVSLKSKPVFVYAVYRATTFIGISAFGIGH